MDQPAFDDLIASISTELEFPTPEARYQYERARAEEQFRRNYEVWETRNRENPPVLAIASGIPGGAKTVWKTAERDEVVIATSLKHSIGLFLHQELTAYGNLLLSARTPGSEAVVSFEQHAAELLKEAFTRKWLYGLSRLELSKDEFADRFWALRTEAVERARHEFEGLVWKTDAERTALCERGPVLPGVVPVQAEAVEVPAQPETDTNDNGDGVDAVATERKRLIDAFKAKAREQGIRVTDKLVAKAANPKWNDRTMVTWWKRNDPKSKPPHDKKIRAVLGRDPSSIWPE